jgi:hypothetical protein
MRLWQSHGFLQGEARVQAHKKKHHAMDGPDREPAQRSIVIDGRFEVLGRYGFGGSQFRFRALGFFL